MGQGSEEIEEAPLLGTAELGTIPARKGSPLSLRSGSERNLDESLGGCEVWKPEIEEVAQGVLGLRHAPRWTANGPNAEALSVDSWTTKTNHANGHATS